MQHGSLDKDKIYNNGEGFIAEFPKDTVLYYCCHTSDLYYDQKVGGLQDWFFKFCLMFFFFNFNQAKESELQKNSPSVRKNPKTLAISTSFFFGIVL